MKVSVFRTNNCFTGFVVLLLLSFIISLVLPRFRVVGREETRASWYGGDFHRRRTASGTTYNMMNFTAANRVRPLGSWLRITDLETERRVIVKVTDRGPYKTDEKGQALKPLLPHPTRDIDLSYWAARKLGLLKSGVKRIRVEYLSK